MNGWSPPIMNGMFTLKENAYNFRNAREFMCVKSNTLKYGLNTISYKGPQLWQHLPMSIKQTKTINAFKNKIKQWKPKCTCNLCQNYIAGVGYI